MTKFDIREWKKQNRRFVINENKSMDMVTEANADNKHFGSDTITMKQPIFFWDGDDDEVGITVKAPFKYAKSETNFAPDKMMALWNKGKDYKSAGGTLKMGQKFKWTGKYWEGQGYDDYSIYPDNPVLRYFKKA